MHSGYEDFDKLKLILFRFYYTYWIAGKTLSKIKQTSFNMIKWVKEKKTIDQIQVELDKKAEEDRVIKDAIDSLNSINVYNTPWIKPLFLMIEYNQTDITLPFIPLSKDLHIEHILPEKYHKFSEWNQVITKDVAKEWLNRPGNMTLLNGSKNIEASNNPFDKKINVYQGRGLYSDKDTKISGFSISQKIVNEYKQDLYEKKWNETAIKARWNWFCDEVEKLISIDLKGIKLEAE